MKPVISKLFTDFFNSEKAGGFILLGCTIISLFLANTSIERDTYISGIRKLGLKHAPSSSISD